MGTTCQKQGSVVGGILLIAGSCIGAGMLGLPILTGMAGFFPSLVMFIVACFFMTSTALLLVEVDAWFKEESNFITMCQKMMGEFGRILCWILYLFLFYALLMGYIALSGHHVTSFFKSTTSLSIPVWIGSVFFVLLFGSFAYLGTRAVDHLNRVLMLGKIIAYFTLLVVGFSYVSPQLLSYTDSRYAFFALPILIISFGFHNMIPTLSHYLGGDIRRIKQSILGGAALTLSIYLFWQIIALGSLPIGGEHGILDSYKNGVDAAEALKGYVKSAWVGHSAQVLAFFAILTSFLAQALSLIHFLSDGFKLKHDKKEPLSMCFLALIPPLILAIIYPAIFYQAFNFAGGICAVILFGLFPLFMIVRGRYIQKLSVSYTTYGGVRLLIILFAIAIFIIFYQASQMMGFTLFPKPQ